MYGILAAIFLLPVLVTSYPQVPHSHVASGERGLRSLKHFGPAVPAMLLGFSAMLIGNLFSIQIPFLLNQAGLGEPARIAGILMGLALVSSLGSLTYGGASSRLGTRLLVHVIFLMLGAGALILLAASTTALFALGALIGGFASVLALLPR